MKDIYYMERCAKCCPNYRQLFQNLICTHFKGRFEKLRKTTINFAMSVRLKAHQHKMKWSVFQNPVEEVQVMLKSDNNNRYFV
jgi:hypothetical protein